MLSFKYWGRLKGPQRGALGVTPMPKRVEPLSPSAVASAKPQAKPYKLADGGGLFLLVQPTSAKWWRWKYRRPGTHKENALSLGTYPE